MEQVNKWQEIISDYLNQFFQTIVQVLPNIFGAILLLILGWILASLIKFTTRKLLKTKALCTFTQKLNNFIQTPDISIDSADVISRFIYWVILLLFFVAAAETLGWNSVSQAISKLLEYLPALLSAVIILVIGLYIASSVRTFIRTTLQSLKVNSARIVSSFAFYVIALLVVLTALNQAGIDTTIITSNLSLIIGSVMVAFALAFALASKDILRNILSSFYSRQNFRTGDVIRLGDLQGKIISIDSVSVIIRTENSEVIFPSSTLITQKVEKIIG